MRYSVIPGMHLSRLKAGMKVLLTLFLICLGLGLWVSALKYTDRAPFDAAGASRYYAGDPTSEDDPLAALGVAESGEAGLVTHEPRKSRQFLVDITHPHAFTVPVLFFILFHFLALTRMKEWQKVCCHFYGFASLVAAFGMPWLVANHSELGWLFIATGINLFACLILVMLYLLYETWCVRPPRSANRESPAIPNA